MVRKLTRREFFTATAGTTFGLVTGCTSSRQGRAPALTIAAPAGSEPDVAETATVATVASLTV